MNKRSYLGYILFTASVGLLLLLNWLGIFRTIWGINTAILLALFGGYKIYYNAISALFERRISADLAIVIAIGAALAIGEYVAAAEAVFIMLIGEGLEEYASRRARASIERLIDLSPKLARIRRETNGETGEIEVPIESVREGDVVLVRPGERIPVDGQIRNGHASINEAPITGESLPIDKGPGVQVFAGTINCVGVLEIETERVGEDTTLARIISLIEGAEEKRAPLVRLADRYATYFLPIILLSGALTLYFTEEWTRTVAVLLVACPCALILATPAAIVAAIGRLAREGVLVKSGASLESAARADCFVFDKTGTMSRGEPTLGHIVRLNGRSEDDLLGLAALAEQGSEHPIARLIIREASERDLPIREVEEFRVEPGLGIEARQNGQRVIVGNRRMMETRNIPLSEDVEEALTASEREGESAVLVAENNEIQGLLSFRDAMRSEAPEMIEALRSRGIERIILLTGDKAVVAKNMGHSAGVEEIYSELLPHEKVALLDKLRREGRRVVMIGDGINDAPALASADVGIAMGMAGSDITIEEADIVLMNDRLDRLPFMLDVGRAALSTIHQNILLFALAINILAVFAASCGILGPAGAAATHQVAALLVVLNSLRLLAYGKIAENRYISQLTANGRSAYRFFGEAAGEFDITVCLRWLKKNQKSVLHWSALSLIAIYFATGIYILGPGEGAVVKRFGRLLPQVQSPGLHFRLPWPFEEVVVFKPNQIRVVEIGFRNTLRDPDGVSQPAEPIAYEWNLAHKSGRYEKRLDESKMLTGDENLIEVNAVVQYSVADPEKYLFAASDIETLLRVSSESVIRSLIGSSSLDEILTTSRKQIEGRTALEIQGKIDSYPSGIKIVAVQLQDVHPSLEVVDAFRGVSSAYEEKSRLINQAEGYYREQVELAKGEAWKQLIDAGLYTIERTNHSTGDADRFSQSAEAYRRGPEVTEARLYLETVEQTLAGRQIFIVNTPRSGRRQILFVDSKGVPLEMGAAVSSVR